MTRRIWIIVIIVVALGAGAAWWWTRPTAPTVTYRTATIDRGDLQETITANGIINPVRVVSVGTQVSGTVQALYTDFNARVTAGQ
ncbi:hypothetical protein IP88_09100, partial [alpha proteobacterium AAP81b]